MQATEARPRGRAGRHWRVTNGKVDQGQLAALLSPIIEQVDPELLIVFGSAARGSMTDESDLDLLVVKDVEDLRGLAVRARRSLPPVHPPIDVVPATRGLLRRHRDSLSWVYGPAVDEGIVAYERSDTACGGRRAREVVFPLEESESARMVRLFRYRREEAMDWLRKAQSDLTVVNSGDTTIDPDARCYSAQAATEKALKALLVAHGHPVRGEHQLSDLAREVAQAGERLPAGATDEQLDRLSEYSGPAQYPGWQGETTEADEERFCEIARSIHEHARRRTPVILKARELGRTQNPE